MGDGCAETASRRRRVRPVSDERGAREDGADGRALYAAPLAVNQAHAAEAEPVRLAQILLDRALYVARRKGVEIEYVRNLQADRLREGIVEIDRFIIVVNVGARCIGRTRRLRPSCKPSLPNIA